ncbi:MAG TPA: hypothetical protein VN643_13045 [Pyrinomonadaceae bacterium]|nr:hypothetical protein [Pyrinomonadaceae bacterium]
MSTAVVGQTNSNSNAARVIFWAGLIAGTLDITGACVVAWLRAGVTPVRVFQSVASGVFGAASFQGGTKTAAFGLLFHFIIATIWGAVYYFASRKLPFLINQTVIAGFFYGVVVHLFMNWVVIPLSNVPKRPATLSGQIIGMAIIIVCVGLPIATIVRRFSK